MTIFTDILYILLTNIAYNYIPCKQLARLNDESSHSDIIHIIIHIIFFFISVLMFPGWKMLTTIIAKYYEQF